MINTSVNGTNRSDSTSESWRQSHAANNALDPTTADGSVLFESLFTADFFRSAVSSKNNSGPTVTTDSSPKESVATDDTDKSADTEKSNTAQASNGDQTVENLDNLLFGAPKNIEHKGERPSALTKKKDDKDKEGSKDQQTPSNVAPYCPPPNFEPTKQNQTTDKAQDGADTKAATGGEKTPTNQLPQSNLPVDTKDASNSAENQANTNAPQVNTQQPLPLQAIKPETQQAANKGEVPAQQADLSNSDKTSIKKTDSRVSQARNDDSTKQTRSQQSEETDTDRDRGGRDKPQNRRAERLEEQRVAPKEEPARSEVSNESTKTADQKQTQTQASTDNLSVQAATATPTVDTSLASSLATVPSVDTTSIAPTLTDMASAVAASAIASATAALTSTVTTAQPSASVATSAVSSVDPTTSSASGASAVSQPAVPTRSDAAESTTGTARGANPASTEPLTEYQQSRLLQRVLKGLDRLDEDSSVVRLRLHPPELGALEMSLHVSQQKLSATINVDSEATRQVLQDNLPQLQSKLAERGITLEKFDIQLQSPSSANNQGGAFYQQPGFGGGGGTWSGQSGQGRAFGEARWNQIRPQSVEGTEAAQTSHVSRYYSGQNLNLRA